MVVKLIAHHPPHILVMFNTIFTVPKTSINRHKSLLHVMVFSWVLPWSKPLMVSLCPCEALKEKRITVVAQLKQLQGETEPIVKMFEDPETTKQMQSTR